jgi:hypothetical protein
MVIASVKTPTRDAADLESAADRRECEWRNGNVG